MNKSASSRRMFLKKTTLAALATTVWPGMPGFLRPPGTRHIGLQLYSLRADMAKNPTATIEAVAKMGYKEIEAYGFEA
ncbi:MAG: sugar phosphate isomerase/epimerase, partial [Saprospiraceae bacterium]